ncbi:MAG: hypothetical protein AAGJ35_05690, partial [Myxococcota bacterium]
VFSVALCRGQVMRQGRGERHSRVLGVEVCGAWIYRQDRLQRMVSGFGGRAHSFRQWGLGWLEVLLLLLSLSILGAAGIETLRRWRRSTQNGEALLNIKSIMSGIKLYLDERRVNKKPVNYPRTDFTPSEKPCSWGHALYPARPQLWRRPTWKKIGFDIQGKHFYRYRIRTSMEPKVSAFFVEAEGDLDCDQQMGRFKLRGVLSKKGELAVQGLVLYRPLE